MAISDDLDGYIEYLQQSILTPEWKYAFDHSHHVNYWKSESIFQRFINSYSNMYSPSIIAVYKKELLSFEPSNQFDMYSDRAIFEPILGEVSEIASELGLSLDRSVSIVSSTSANPGPLAYPSTGDHLLFIGQGTSSFCNYWAKAFSAIVNTLASHVKGKVMNEDMVSVCFNQNPLLLLLPTKLAAYQAFTGTLLAFGEVPEANEFYQYRRELLNAMEVFIVAHEYAHFLAEERIEKYRGSLTPQVSMELETFCDEVGMSICQHFGAKYSNFLAYTGTGPMIFFTAMILSDIARKELKISRSEEGSIHPDHSQRIIAIQKKSISGAPEDQKKKVSSFINEFSIISNFLEEEVRTILCSTRRKAP